MIPHTSRSSLSRVQTLGNRGRHALAVNIELAKKVFQLSVPRPQQDAADGERLDAYVSGRTLYCVTHTARP